ncbi:type II and III secretion system protein [Dechloromonas sp. CZR5]|uniref:type II and III secretion system protein n=1 Tax=Dechloromonas sp. CZR5 TaxID=2608630 RepID=UPI00123D2105|nr:type II and III secretion system protein [Dechloromonas sp. CZR5]
MKTMLKCLLAGLMALWFGIVAAQQMEIIQLRSKTADEVIPALLPLLEPNGTLTGMNDQLFLKASPRNRDEIKRALAAMDRPSRRLIIRISQNRQAEDSARGGEVSGQVTLGSTRRNNVGATVWDTKSVRGESASQMVQTVEGGRAYIQVGRSLAVPMRQVVVGPGGTYINEGTVYRDIGSGFYATPRINGQRVTLEISQQAENFDPAYGRGGVNSQRLATTVSGTLGEWIELGGSGRQAAGQQGGAFSVGTSDARETRSIWLKVEEAE